MSQERESHNSFEKSATFYLEAANLALLNGQTRLAIYLFRAAFEIESSYTTIISSQIIDGLRKAWDLACELSDRSTAESIHNDLGAFNSYEQNEQAVMRLQALAMNKLEEMGITEHDIENLVGALEHEFMNPDNDLFDSLKSMLEQLEVPELEGFDEGTAFRSARLSLPEVVGFDNEAVGHSDATHAGVASTGATHTGATHADAVPADIASNDAASADAVHADAAHADADDTDAADSSGESLAHSDLRSGLDLDAAAILPWQNGLARLGRQLREFRNRKQESAPQRFDYETLAGYQHAIEHMREFGFLSGADGKQREFVERAAMMHGLPRLSLNDTFLFTGPSREDVALFAHATIGEIGYPVVFVAVERDPSGNGMIKLSGPFRRAFFGGPPDIMDMATPCIVFIENIDYLQQMFNDEQIAMQKNHGRPRGMMQGMGRSMQVEIGGYLKALRQKPGMVMIATASDTVAIGEPLRNLLGPIRKVDILSPDIEERLEVLHVFASEHPSFAATDFDRVALCTEGLSRHDLVSAAHTAVEQAYQKTLRTGIYNHVSIGDVLVKLASLVEHTSSEYQRIEDEVVTQFLDSLESEDML